MALFIKETYVNDTANAIFGDSMGWFEAFTDDIGTLFRDLQKEYGKASKMYRDLKDGGAEQIGWVFSKKMKYDDTKEFYIRSVWVELSSTKPEKQCKTVNVTNPFKKTA